MLTKEGDTLPDVSQSLASETGFHGLIFEEQVAVDTEGVVCIRFESLAVGQQLSPQIVPAMAELDLGFGCLIAVRLRESNPWRVLRQTPMSWLKSTQEGRTDRKGRKLAVGLTPALSRCPRPGPGCPRRSGR